MTCPRCGNKWDVSKSPCSRCGLFVQLPRGLQTQTSSQEAIGAPVHTGSAPQSEASENTGILPLSLKKVSHPLSPQQHESLPITQDGGEPKATKSRPLLRSNRLVLFPLEAQENVQAAQAEVSVIPPLYQLEELSPSPTDDGLQPGTLLRGERYCLREVVGRQGWLSGSSETMWVAQDAQHADARVMICELAVPESGLLMVRSLLRAATISLTSIGRHPRIPMLWDVFSERRRHFFVFEPVNGESLLARLQRNGRPLPEREVVDCCLQIAEVLIFLSRQEPPLTHGLISPEHIKERSPTQHMLINFSIILAGGQTQLLSDIERSLLSPYTAPDFSNYPLDSRSDLYALLASAYHLATGEVPKAGKEGGGIARARSINPALSVKFDAILDKGLQSSVSQRYQHAVELRQDLLLLRAEREAASISGKLKAQLQPEHSRQPDTAHSVAAPIAYAVTAQPAAVPVMPPVSMSDSDQEAQKLFRVPMVDVPGLKHHSDLRIMQFWFAVVLVCLLVLLLLSRVLH